MSSWCGWVSVRLDDEMRWMLGWGGRIISRHESDYVDVSERWMLGICRVKCVNMLNV
jgi:hypothetical protein